VERYNQGVPEPKLDSSEPTQQSPLQQRTVSGTIPKVTPPPQAADANGRSSPASSFLTELDAPSFERFRSSQPQAAVAANDSSVSGVRPSVSASADALESLAPARDSDPALTSSLVELTDVDAIPDSDRAALTDASDSVRSPKVTASEPAQSNEPNVSTRWQTHVSEDMSLDTMLELPGAELDPRQRLAWRFKAVFTGWKMLLPLCSAQTVRAQLLEEMRRYERLLRSSGPTPKNRGDKQLSDALHLQLNEGKTAQLERALSELEGLVLSADASISQEAFKARWNRDHTELRQLLRYARLLACRRFGIGYRRDRFEALAVELLTQRLPSGRLQLMSRRRASQVLRQLLRGLYRPPASPEDNKQAVTFLREALDRLDAIGSAKEFFDSGLYLDIYGYKISRHDRLLSPEFLYLSVAIEVDIHNLLLSWSQASAAESGRPFSLAPLQLQFRAQKEAAQAVFSDFHKPLAGSAAPPKATPSLEPKKARSQPAARATARPKAAPPSKLPRYLAAGLFALGALAANLYVTDVVRFREPPRGLAQDVLRGLSPLLITARLSADGKRLSGSVSRPTWVKLSARERNQAAEHMADELKRRGIDHAELLAYKARAIQIDYGSVVYVDDATHAP
jgi:hypothetical protein